MAKSEWCPMCSSPDTQPIAGWGAAWPGDKHDYKCQDCGHIYSVVVPEPPSDYEGDGVYADNH